MMDDKQLTEEYLDGKVVFPGKIIRVEHWHVACPTAKLPCARWRAILARRALSRWMMTGT